MKIQKINILDESVANVIAAGEVVENPASMVKELVENSLDAKASRIKIIVSNRGRKVKVIDDGTGMTEEDLFLSIERHATSKILKKEDIFNLLTYGFRGEALASIASVSKMRISTRHKGEKTGNEIKVVGGDITKSGEVVKNIGTTVDVRSLFYNTPARLKFLRTKTTEYNKIRDIILKEALANSKVSFSLVLDKNETIKTSGRGPENTILELFGKKVLKNMKKFEYGYLGNLDILRSNKNRIFTYFNKRYAYSKIIQKAVIDGYYTKLTKGKYPFAIIFLELDPSKIDVNVHPSKKIVKFSDGRRIYRDVKQKVEEAIFEKERDLMPSIDLEKTEYDKEEQEEQKLFISENNNFQNDKKNMDIKKTKGNPFLKEESQSKINHKAKEGISKQEDKSNKQDYEVDFRIIGQLKNMYILVETKKGLEIYDQHIVHERILYEELKSKYYSKDIKVQKLLVPINIDLEYEEKQVLMENLKKFENFGFLIEDFGDERIIIREVPSFNWRDSIENLIKKAIYEILDNKDNLKDLREQIIISMSCKGAIKAGEKLEKKEMEILIKKLHKIGKYTCPHGRPIIIKLDFLELEKKFKRR
ncbi:MAG: DNA mismatch repair endonuclease MutL [Fusobacteriota bacterium]